jgi:hypothetical protein
MRMDDDGAGSAIDSTPAGEFISLMSRRNPVELENLRTEAWCSGSHN